MDEPSFSEVAEDGRERLHDRRVAFRGLADELDTLLDEQLAGLADEATRAARIAAELEERGRLLTERERDPIDQRERLRTAEREIADVRRRLEELRVDAEGLRARERELSKLQEGLSAAMERAAEVERGGAERDSELARLQGEVEPRLAEVERRERELAARAEERAAHASELSEREQGRPSVRRSWPAARRRSQRQSGGGRPTRNGCGGRGASSMSASATPRCGSRNSPHLPPSWG